MTKKAIFLFVFLCILFLVMVIISGCTTYAKCPAAPDMKPLDLPVWHLKSNASNSQTVKAIVESNKMCVNHDAECYNYLGDFMSKN
jgi:hypothetical protein